MVLPERSQELKKLKKLLSLYNKYKNEHSEFTFMEETLKNTKQIVPPVEQKSFWSTKRLHDPTSIIN